MKWKNILKLVAMGLVFILVVTVLIGVLPDGVRSQIASEPGRMMVDKDIFSSLKAPRVDGSRVLDRLKSLVSIEPLSSDPTTEEEQGEILIIDADDYYASAYGKHGNDLKTALNEIVDDHEALTYKAVWDALKETDEDPDNPDNVILLYTGRSEPKSHNGTDPDGWNREHVWAKSHGDFGTTMGAGTDLHHIRPADVTVNSSRNNKNFDFSDNPHPEAVLCRHDSDSFEPADSVKGDVARMLFYMAVRYEGDGDEPDLELSESLKASKEPYHGKLSTLLEWHESDPVSAFEKRRNEIIYDKYQGNRNPFIDHPEWVEDIWKAAS